MSSNLPTIGHEANLSAGLQEIHTQRLAIEKELAEMVASAGKSSLLKSEVLKYHLAEIAKDDKTIHDIGREINRLKSLIFRHIPGIFGNKNGATNAYIAKLEELHTNMQAENTLVETYAEHVKPETIKSLVAEARSGAKAAHAAGIKAFADEFTAFKTAYQEASEGITTLRKAISDKHVELAKLVGKNEADAMIDVFKSGATPAHGDPKVLTLIRGIEKDLTKVTQLDEQRAKGLLQMMGKIETHPQHLAALNDFTAEVTATQRGALATHAGINAEKMSAAVAFHAEQAAMQAGQAVAKVDRAAAGIVSEYEKASKAITEAKRSQNTAFAELIKLVGKTEAKALYSKVASGEVSLESLPEAQAAIFKTMDACRDARIAAQEQAHKVFPHLVNALGEEKAIAMRSEHINASIAELGTHADALYQEAESLFQATKKTGTALAKIGQEAGEQGAKAEEELGAAGRKTEEELRDLGRKAKDMAKGLTEEGNGRKLIIGGALAAVALVGGLIAFGDKGQRKTHAERIREQQADPLTRSV